MRQENFPEQAIKNSHRLSRLRVVELVVPNSTVQQIDYLFHALARKRSDQLHLII